MPDMNDFHAFKSTSGGSGGGSGGSITTKFKSSCYCFVSITL